MNTTLDHGTICPACRQARQDGHTYRQGTLEWSGPWLAAFATLSCRDIYCGATYDSGTGEHLDSYPIATRS